jgi:hypothetical protein
VRGRARLPLCPAWNLPGARRGLGFVRGRSSICSVAKRLSLPLLTPEPSLPTVDALRRKLGGRASTEPGAGALVTVPSASGMPVAGVVLFIQGDDLDVWIDHNTVRRTRRASTGPLAGEGSPSRDLAAVAADARVFGGLAEGQRVSYLDGERLAEGLLVEKCRFGAVIQRDDGKLVALGFRRVWPANPSDDSRN